jgi:hypothetical protein
MLEPAGCPAVPSTPTITFDSVRLGTMVEGN